MASSPSAEASGGTAVPTSIDPAQLVTADEASKLAGVTFGACQVDTTSNNGKICVYGTSANTFSVIVAVAPDEATAKSAEQDAIAELQKNATQLAGQGLKVTQIPNFAPGADAAVLNASISVLGKTLGATAIYVLKGKTFFGFSDLALDKAPPTTDAMKAQAMTTLGRIP
jgi:hypothetical protein